MEAIIIHFGMTITNRVQKLQPYKYGNKEEETMLGLNIFDFEARWLDEVVPSFTTPDPLAEKYYSISPYAYCGNNPIRFVDPTGMDTVWVNKNNDVIAYIPGGDEVMVVNDPLPEVTVTAPSRKIDASAIMAGTLAAATMLAVDDATVVGIADDPAIPFVIAGGALLAGSVWLYDNIKTPSPSTPYYDPATDSSRNEKHGDDGRAKTKAEKQIADLEKQKEGAPRKKRMRLI